MHSNESPGPELKSTGLTYSFITSPVALLPLLSLKIENPVTSGLRQTAACICINKEFERPAAAYSVSPYFLFLFYLAAVESRAEGQSAI